MMSVITEGAHDTQGDHVTATQQVETGRQKLAVTAQAGTHINLRIPDPITTIAAFPTHTSWFDSTYS